MCEFCSGNILKNHKGETIFSIFDLNVTFGLDLELLENRYFKLQQLYKNNFVKQQKINHAYKIIKNPLKRSVYILELNDNSKSSSLSGLRSLHDA